MSEGQDQWRREVQGTERPGRRKERVHIYQNHQELKHVIWGRVATSQIIELPGTVLSRHEPHTAISILLIYISIN